MTSLAFDTHKAVKDLTNAGADETLAEAMVATIGDAVTWNVASKADIEGLRKDTKADLAGLRKDTKADLAGLRKDTKADLAGLRKDMTARMDGLEQGMKAMGEQLTAQIKISGQRTTIILGSIAAAGVAVIGVLDRIF